MLLSFWIMIKFYVFVLSKGLFPFEHPHEGLRPLDPCGKIAKGNRGENINVDRVPSSAGAGHSRRTSEASLKTRCGGKCPARIRADASFASIAEMAHANC